MATRTIANRNNFIRWNKIGGQPYLIEDLPTKKLPEFYETDSNNDVDQSTSSDSNSLSASSDFGIFWGNSGSTLYVVENAGDRIRQYAASTPYDASTIVSGSALTTTANNTSPFDVFVTPTGTKFFTIDFGTDNVQEWALSTPYDITTGTHTTNLAITADIYCLDFNTDGTIMFVLQDTGAAKRVITYTLSTGFDLSTASSSSNLNVATETTTPRWMSVSEDGTRMYVFDGSTDIVYQYDLSTAFDITTATYSGFNYDLNNITSNPVSLYLRDYTEYFYVDATAVTVETVSTGSELIPPPTEYGNQSQFEDIEGAIVTLFPNETFRFYANLDTLETAGDFANWKLRLVFSDTFITAYENIATLQDDLIDGYSFRFYIDSLTVPSTWADGCYRMVIDDGTNVLFISNVIKVSNTIAPYSNRIQYRNDKNILNFNYEGLPTYYNEFRIDLVVRNPSFSVQQEGYTLVSGKWNPVRTVKGRNKEFITEAYNEYDHEAWNAATIHELEIFEEGDFRRYDRGEGSEYTIEWQNNYPQADGTIVLERRDSYSSNKNV